MSKEDITNGLTDLLQVFTLDARNHGESPHTNEMSLELMSSDLISFLSENDIRRCVLIGHSMGGRTAMLTALQCPTLIESLIVVDVSPVPSPGELFRSIVYIICHVRIMLSILSTRFLSVNWLITLTRAHNSVHDSRVEITN